MKKVRNIVKNVSVEVVAEKYVYCTFYYNGMYFPFSLSTHNDLERFSQHIIG
jgi:hypothetical protein